jgi:Zn finger protein HypA/HybF involved in hydrogenase expression
MPRQMRFSGRELSEPQWQQLMETSFGDGVKDAEGVEEFELSEDAVPQYYCETCDHDFPGESQELDDAPLICPHCGSAPDKQAVTVTYGEHKLVTFPFFIPRPEE